MSLTNVSRSEELEGSYPTSLASRLKAICDGEVRRVAVSIVPAGPYPGPAAGAPPVEWHGLRWNRSANGFASPRPTATRLVTLHPALAVATRYRPVLAEAIGGTAHAVRAAITTLRDGVDAARAGHGVWSDWNAKAQLVVIRSKRRQHRDAIGAARRLAAELLAAQREAA